MHVHVKILPASEIAARRKALDAAERSGIREGLPPVSPVAREIAGRYATGELTADEAVALIVQQYREP
jgi:Antitoxin VbhA